LMGGLLHLV